uniref:Uncharacterized protein n=1 Tax=Kalanchoe fedtschenkoi TaxID=63787 RepID=A0A7N0USP2_KALFE
MDLSLSAYGLELSLVMLCTYVCCVVCICGQHDDEEEEDVVMEAPPDSRHCYTHYLEYQRCRKARGKEAPECRKLAKYYMASCPSELIERWDEQVERGTFPARI